MKKHFLSLRFFLLFALCSRAMEKKARRQCLYTAKA